MVKFLNPVPVELQANAQVYASSLNSSGQVVWMATSCPHQGAPCVYSYFLSGALGSGSKPIVSNIVYQAVAGVADNGRILWVPGVTPPAPAYGDVTDLKSLLAQLNVPGTTTFGGMTSAGEILLRPPARVTGFDAMGLTIVPMPILVGGQVADMLAVNNEKRAFGFIDEPTANPRVVQNSQFWLTGPNLQAPAKLLVDPCKPASDAGGYGAIMAVNAVPQMLVVSHREFFLYSPDYESGKCVAVKIYEPPAPATAYYKGMNLKGDIVGNISTPGISGSDAILVTKQGTVRNDLNSQTLKVAADRLEQADFINDAGMIVGEGVTTVNGKFTISFAYLLIPLH
jgi:hypothetical protein